jgi:hypothetical protein
MNEEIFRHPRPAPEPTPSSKAKAAKAKADRTVKPADVKKPAPSRGRKAKA